MSSEVEAVCGYTEEVSTARFIYISVAGILALLGCFSNIVLFSVFCRRQISNSPPNLYPAVLTLLDFTICLLFIFVYVVDVTMIRLQNLDLFNFYHSYIVYAFSAVKIVQFLIPYMLMLATLERYTWITNRHRKLAFFQPRGRYISLCGVIITAVVLRLPAAYALKITEFPNCQDPLRTLAVDIKEWAKDNVLYTFYDVYGMTFLQTFLPFVVLFSLNVVIVHRLAKVDKKNRNQKKTSATLNVKKHCEVEYTKLGRRSLRLMNSLNSLSKMPVIVRNAVFTMVVIVFSYLVSNSFHIFLTLLEVGKASILYDDMDPYKASSFYTLLADSVSLVYMSTSAIRILIYMKCNKTIRRRVFRIIFRNSKNHVLSKSSVVSQ